MPLQDLLLQIDSYPDPTPDQAIDAAVAFARAIGGRLTAIAAQVDIPLSSNALADRLINLSGMQKEWEERSFAGCRAAVRHFEASARTAGVYGGAEVQKIDLYSVDDALALRARTRDLCMVPLGKPYDGQLALAQQMIFQSGRPVLFFAASRPILSNDMIGNVVVAWDGSRSSARALADALPILERAGSVRVVTFLNEKEGAQGGLGAEVIRHLATHGLKAIAEEVDAKNLGIGHAIDDYMVKSAADLLVMGAYGHSRMLEFVLGGATQHVLRAPVAAVFLSH